MKTKEIISYESENVNTILLHVNKSVCRVYEASAYRLSSHVEMEKVHCKRCRSQNAHLLYVWFHASKLSKVLDGLHLKGFYPVSRKDDCIILQHSHNEDMEHFFGWREKTLQNIDVMLQSVEMQAAR